MRRAQALDIDVHSVLQSLEPDAVLRVLEDYRSPASTDANGATPNPGLVLKLLTSIGGRPEPGEEASGEVPPSLAEETRDQDQPPPPEEAVIEPEQVSSEPADPLDAPGTEPDSDPVVREGESTPTAWRMPTNRYQGRRTGADPSLAQLPLQSEPGYRAESTIESPRVDPLDAAPDSPSDSVGWGRTLAKIPYRSTKALGRVLYRWTEKLVIRLERDSSQPVLEFVEQSRERRRVILAAGAIVASTAILATTFAIMRPTHAAESEVIVTTSGSGASDLDRELQSFIVVAESQAVLGPVAEEFGISVPELRDSFSSEIIGDSTVLRFVVARQDLESAVAMNQAILNSYLLVANQPADQAQAAFLDAEISTVQQELGVASDRLEVLDAAEAANEASRVRIETDRAIAQNRLASLESRLVDLQSFGEAPPGAISFVSTQVEETRALIDGLVAELQTLESADSAAARGEAEALRDERSALRSELSQLEATKTDLALDQIGGPRAGVLAPTHEVEDSLGLTPIRALALGILVGGALAFAWVVAATQFRKRP
jgi:capsular polysaccharide biosynthesis protein